MVIRLHDAQHPQAVSPLRMTAGRIAVVNNIEFDHADIYWTDVIAQRTAIWPSPGATTDTVGAQHEGM